MQIRCASKERMMNMHTYAIVTDGSCDLPKNICSEYGLTVIPLYYTLSGAVTKRYPDREKGFDSEDFYKMLRSGIQVKTSSPNLDDFRDVFVPLLKSGKDVLYIGFSSGLSGTFNVGRLCAQELREEFPERKITVLDSLCASLGLGLVVLETLKLQRRGGSYEDAVSLARSHAARMHHWFTVDDLMHLKRGGRIGSGTAVMGTVLQIKPLLRMSTEGTLEVFSKTRARRNALKQLADLVGENILPGTAAAISHANCLEDARFIRDILRRVYRLDNILIEDIDPAVGGHGGPGAIAVFCLGKER